MGFDSGREVIIRNYEDELDTLDALVRENKVREKTNLQKANEAEMLLEIEKLRALERKATSTGGSSPQLRAELPQAEKQGRARDIVAKEVGFDSGREVERAIVAAKAVKEAESNSFQRDARSTGVIRQHQ